MIIYTDGSCLKNGYDGSSGGYGVVVFDNDDNVLECYSKFSIETTNNREELKAVLYALKNYGTNNSNVIVYSDSSYVVNTLTLWMFNWEKNGWLKSDNKTPENLDLIKEYYNCLKRGCKIDLRRIKGHAGILGNELADKLATGKITEKEVMEKYGKEKSLYYR